VHGENRQAAIAKMKCALTEFVVGPVKTTIPLHLRLLESEPFLTADFDIHYVERLLKEELV
jgi:acetyl-CoA carboxylase, biotin carboxylase subunit